MVHLCAVEGALAGRTGSSHMRWMPAVAPSAPRDRSPGSCRLKADRLLAIDGDGDWKRVGELR